METLPVKTQELGLKKVTGLQKEPQKVQLVSGTAREQGEVLWVCHVKAGPLKI